MPGGLTPPLSVIASWPPANTTNPETHGPADIILVAMFGSIALITVTLRLWARCVIQHRAGWDDLLTGLALIPVLGLAICFSINSRLYGANLHTWDSSLPNLVMQRKMALTNEMLYVFGSGMVRISVLLFYRRMGFRSISRGFVVAIHVSIASVIAYSIAFIVVIFASCTPLNAFWNQVNPKWEATHTWKCYNEPVHLLAASSIALIQDVIATTLPAILCWNLRISSREKVALGSIFVVGYMTAVIAAVRTYFIVKMYYYSYDATWNSWYCWLLAMMEVLIALICSSLPAVRVFFSQYKNSLSIVTTAREIKSAIHSRRKGSSSAPQSSERSSSTVQLSQAVQGKSSLYSVDEETDLEMHRLPAQ
ncbi:hypothetical protein BDV25DRAFT_143484 [Aspergillus avenaceus]|uniref:Rhodopsin domain-containing protein n=1 Tax=Aspergillus avenaceus TaxID=36643 RepID=A0A5N6TJW2_ASPAV|nr:hypothetical protein BDV25DRAFT_143484 [Aspergillus avenaceus]